MKKVLFLQNNGKSFGGVWQVNKLVGEELIKHEYDVSIIAIRNNKADIELEHDPKLHVGAINEIDEWGTYSGQDILKELKDIRPFKAIKMTLSRIKYQIILAKDKKKLHQFIEDYKPNYIIVSHYQVLDMIPKNYLNITINEQHSSFAAAINHRATKKTFDKYKDKIKFVWLTKNTMDQAIKYGIKNSTYIYNAVRFTSDEVADVIKNKKLITICRLSVDKDVKRMITIAKELFKDKKLKDWKLEIYGDGPQYSEIKIKVGNHPQIKLMGLTKNPKDKLLTASINLNTSPYEGFSLSILEANECGVPTIAFNFGESAEEQIINNKTGIIAKDNQDYINNLKELMSNEDKLKELSHNCKEFNKDFRIDSIIKKWIELFNELNHQETKNETEKKQ